MTFVAIGIVESGLETKESMNQLQIEGNDKRLTKLNGVWWGVQVSIWIACGTNATLRYHLDSLNSSRRVRAEFVDVPLIVMIPLSPQSVIVTLGE